MSLSATTDRLPSCLYSDIYIYIYSEMSNFMILNVNQ